MVSHGASPRSRRQYLGNSSPRALPHEGGLNGSGTWTQNAGTHGHQALIDRSGQFERAKNSGRLRAPEHILPSSPRALIHMPYIH